MDSLIFIGASIAIVLTTFGVTLGEGRIAKSSMKTLGINPELSGTLMVMTILGIALIETCAIYGLIVAFQILGAENISLATSIGVGLTIGIPGFIVAIVEGQIARNAIEAVLRNPEAKNKIMVSMILFIALIETCAIYGLIIAFQILGN